jgi:hypothetical protein
MEDDLKKNKKWKTTSKERGRRPQKKEKGKRPKKKYIKKLKNNLPKRNGRQTP